jgi:hypothetical protein
MLSKSTWLTGLATLVMLSVGLPAGAQVWGGTPGGDRDDGRWGQNDSRAAYDNGYRRGLERGERDGRDRRPMNYRDEKDYRNGDWGYDRRYGSRDYYRQAFRSGFEAGYSASYSRYGGYGQANGRAVPRGYPGSAPYPNGRYPDRTGGYGRPDGYGYGYANNIAFQNGYRDGLEKGDKDWRSRKSYDVLRHDWYRDGDRHYKKEYGPRNQYKDAYRAGFKQAYDQAFRGGRY